MNKIKSIKNSLGFAHHALLGVAVIAIITLAGVKVLSAIHAQTNTDTSATSGYYAPKGNPLLDASAADTTAQSVANDSASAINPLTSQHTEGPKCWYGSCFYYVSTTTKNTFTATGASVAMSVAQPTVRPKYEHSLMEMAVSNTNLSMDDVIEVGWTVDFPGYMDLLPHLFVYHWVNGRNTCYNGCRFVKNPNSPIQVGESLKDDIGTTANFAINFNVSSKQWQIKYNGSLLGYFPASIWGGTFTRIHSVNVFGEVTVPTKGSLPRSQMGNGIKGSKPGSAVIKNLSLIKSTSPAQLRLQEVSDPNAYNLGDLTTTGVRLGGPGYQ